MKKLFVKGSLALLAAMLLFAFAACPDGNNGPDGPGPGQKSSDAALTLIKTSDGEEGTAPAEAIPGDDWDGLANLSGLTAGQTGTLTIGSAKNVSFSATTASTGATVTYAVTANANTKPADDVFKAITEESGLSNTSRVYFKVVSEDEETTNYYFVRVSVPSTTISGIKMGEGNSISSAGSFGTPNVNIGSAVPGNYDLPYTTGDVTVTVTKNNSNSTTVTWAKTAKGAAAPADTAFAAMTEATGNDVTATVTGGFADEDVFYIKVAAEGATAVYYAFTVNTGGDASLVSLTIDGEDVNLDEGAATFAAAAEVSFDPRNKPEGAGYAIVATPAAGATVAFVYSATALTSEPASFGPLPTQVFAEGSYLYVKVSSQNTKVNRYYKIKVFLPNYVEILYGQPVINEDTIDPLWDDTDWMFYISRNNLVETAPNFQFVNTVDGLYSETGYGHTEALTKAYWDDDGLYIYAQVDFHDFYENASDKTAGTVTARTTSQRGNYESDSVEIFINERLQTVKTGQYGIQYRVAPVIDGNGQTFTDTNPVAAVKAGTQTAISGNDFVTGTGGHRESGSWLYDWRESEKYYSWIRYDETVPTKEVGYSCIAFIPWIKGDATDQVFDTPDGRVKTVGTNDGPEIGLDWQLNTSRPDTTYRDAILTWNGISGVVLENVGLFGTARLITGDMSGKTRP